jgi:mono/diheme cytochrome c family protein
VGRYLKPLPVAALKSSDEKNRIGLIRLHSQERNSLLDFRAMRSYMLGIMGAAVLAIISATSGCSNGQSAPSGTTASAIDAKTLKNTVKPSPKSIESGKRLYDRLCADCHGVAGDGVSEMASILEKAGKIPPSNLTDDTWDLGSTDGEIFMVIRDGSGANMAMKGLNGKPGIVDEDIWNLVNYVRTLHK